MELPLNILSFFFGLLILVLASDWLIQGCVKFSYLFKLAPFFIGLIFVAFGTSAPEAGVSIVAAIKNQKDIALGNIIGSNIANIALVLGVCTLFKPLGIDRRIFKRELPAMLISPLLLYALSLDLLISRIDGLIFLGGFTAFCFFSYKQSRKLAAAGEIDGFRFRRLFERTKSPLAASLLILLSIFGVVFGADLMVRGGVNLARTFGIAPWIIGITVFALGTSLPELAAGLTAAFKKVPSISTGNIIGSNIFNIFFVLGVASLIRPINLASSVLRLELPALVVFTFILFTFMRTAYKITRWEGLALLTGYIGFIVLLIFRC